MTNYTLEVAIADIIKNDATIYSYFPNNTVIILQEGMLNEESFNDYNTDLIITLRTSGMVAVNKLANHYTEVANMQVWKRITSGTDTYEIRQILERVRVLLHLQPITISGINCLQLKWDSDGPELISQFLSAVHQNSKYVAFLYRT